MFDEDFYNFYFPEQGTPCKICEEDIPLEKYRKNGLCDDCEFDSLTPPRWPEVFLAALKTWHDNLAS